MFKYLLLVCVSCVSLATAADKRLPETFKRCSQNGQDVSNCLLYNVPDALRKMRDGIPELSVPSLEPLAVSAIDIKSGNGPVTIRQHYGDINIYGLTSSNLTNYKADLKNYKLVTDSFTPIMNFVANYVMDGRVLLLPIQGKGQCNITMTDLIVKHILIGEPITKKDKIYMKIKDYKVTFVPKKIGFYFSNLFNGNQALGDQMNRFLNENADIVFNELRPAYEESFGLIFKEITNKIFTKVPFNEIFPIEEESN